jgi:iron complex transport system permease protein
VPPHAVFEALTTTSGGSDDVTVIRELRIPRTFLGIGVGACLGLAGALMQSLTRNPLADPGLLGSSWGLRLPGRSTRSRSATTPAARWAPGWAGPGS